MHTSKLFCVATLLAECTVISLSTNPRLLSRERNEKGLPKRAKTVTAETISTTHSNTKEPHNKLNKHTNLAQQAVIFTGFPGIGKSNISALGEYKGYKIQDELEYKKGEEEIFLQRLWEHANLKEILLLPAHPWVRYNTLHSRRQTRLIVKVLVLIKCFKGTGQPYGA